MTNEENERANGPDRAFADWLGDVDRILESKIGLGSEDLPDWNWREAYDEESEPEDAVEDYISGFPEFEVTE